jgi:hypothetical protein
MVSYLSAPSSKDEDQKSFIELFPQLYHQGDPSMASRPKRFSTQLNAYRGLFPFNTLSNLQIFSSSTEI